MRDIVSDPTAWLLLGAVAIGTVLGNILTAVISVVMGHVDE